MIQGRVGRYTTRVISRGASAAPHLLAIISMPAAFALNDTLHNSDLIGVAALVPQTNLPETPSYTESETLKAKIEGFQEDYMGWFQK